MTPQQLVPTLETCKKLKKAGWVKETYFAWAYNNSSFEQPDVIPDWNESDLSAITDINDAYYIINAPTLQELLEDIFASGYRVPAVYLAEAAALLWLELRKE